MPRQTRPRRSRKRWGAGLLAVWAALGLAGCQAPTPAEPVFVPATHASVRVTGRAVHETEVTRFDWPGVYIDFAFTGSSVELVMQDGQNDYDVSIDRGRPSLLRTREGDSTYVLARRLPFGRHEVRVTKRTEGAFGVANFYGFVLPPDGRPLPLDPPPDRRIEFVGDSYVAGYGVDGASPDCSFSRETENANQTFGAVLARRLGAQHHIVAKSGAGVVRNYGVMRRLADDPFMDYYPRALMNEPQPAWRTEQWRPDAVVLRIGRNDFTTMPHPTTKQFERAYYMLVSRFRIQYPNAHIFAVCGPMRDRLPCEPIGRVVRRIHREDKDRGLHFVQLPSTLTRPDDFGCDWHPNATGQQKMADALEPVIRRQLGW